MTSTSVRPSRASRYRKPFGPERLRQFFATRDDLEPAGVADALMKALSFREQEDDLTVFVAEAS
jgi:hypothetical protein